MVQENRIGAQGVLRSLIHSVQRLTGHSRPAVHDPTAVGADIDAAEDPRISGDAAKAAPVLGVVQADPGRASAIGTPDCSQVVPFAYCEQSGVVARVAPCRRLVPPRVGSCGP